MEEQNQEQQTVDTEQEQPSKKGLKRKIAAVLITVLLICAGIYVFNEMKYEEISEILGTTVGALKASFHIAVKKIEEYFNKID